MLLSRKEAHEGFIRLLSESSDFAYMIAPWMSEVIAKDIIKYCSAKEIIVVLEEQNEKNINCVKILQTHPGIRILRDPMLHGKCLITNLEFMTGSSNPTQSGFFKNHEFIEFRTRENRPEEYNEYLEQAKEWIHQSVAFEIDDDNNDNNNKRKKNKKNNGSSVTKYFRRNL